MHTKIKKFAISISSIGIDPLKFLYALRSLPIYINNLIKFYLVNRGGWKINITPMLSDRYSQSGIAKGHYFNIDLWAARLVYQLAPEVLVDVGSRVDGFIGHILTFRSIEVFDIRKLQTKVSGLNFSQVNITDLSDDYKDYADCVTTLHAVEHFGLGRYGDPLLYDGWKIGLQNIAKMVKRQGHLIIAVPVGIERVEFDAHRVFNPLRIVSHIESMGFELKSYSAVCDDGDFHPDIPIEDSSRYQYGCGCFVFIRQ